MNQSNCSLSLVVVVRLEGCDVRGAAVGDLKVCAWLRNSPYKAARSIDWSTHTYGDSAHCGAARHAGASGGSECCPPNHQRATMSAESTKEATAEGHKVTTVVEGTDATAAAPDVASPPESVAIFFDGEPMAGKAETWTTEHVADAATLQFVGPHALPLPLFDKAARRSA